MLLPTGIILSALRNRFHYATTISSQASPSCKPQAGTFHLPEATGFPTLSDPTSPLDFHVPPGPTTSLWRIFILSLLAFFPCLSGVPSELACTSLGATLTTITSEPSPSGRVRGRIEGTEGDGIPRRRQTVSRNPDFWELS